MAATIQKSPCRESLTTEWYNYLRAEVEYDCSFCDAVHTDIRDMEERVTRAYALTARALKSDRVYEIGEIAKRWWGMVAFSTEVLERARLLQETHQICGVDLSTLIECRKEALDRLKLHCPEFAGQCG
jgi:hypothetical protein